MLSVLHALRRCVVLLGVALGLLAPVPAHAHGHLTSSSPAKDAVLAVNPTHIRLEFSETPVLRFTSVTLVDDVFTEVPLRDLRYAPDTRRAITVLLTDALHEGVYTVRWQMAGSDGHPVRGEFMFTIRRPRLPDSAFVASPMPGPPAPAAITAPVVRDSLTVESYEYVGIRWVEYISLALIIGAVVFRFFVLPRGPQAINASLFSRADQRKLRFRAAATGLAASALLIFSAALRLAAQFRVLNGPMEPLDLKEAAEILVRTTWGWGWMVQVVGALAGVLGFTIAGLRGRRSGWTIARVSALMIVVSPALGGHASASGRLMPVTVLADVLHVLAAGGWIGTLAVIVVAVFPVVRRLPPPSRGDALRQLIEPFSRLALRFAATLALTGVLAAGVHLGSVAAVWQTEYGRMLLFKLGGVALIVAVGAYNWKRITPLLAINRGIARFRSTSMLEVALGAIVLLITAILVALPTEITKP